MYYKAIFKVIYYKLKSIDSDLAKEVLKALFLVKYVKGFHASLGNIAILLLPKFDVDLAVFHKQVQEALNLLESQTYIQRSAGDLYEYLTNQEKDVKTKSKAQILTQLLRVNYYQGICSMKSYVIQKLN